MAGLYKRKAALKGKPAWPAPSTPIVHMFPCLKDNYGFLLHDPDSGETACIDTPEPDRILAEAERQGLEDHADLEHALAPRPCRRQRRDQGRHRLLRSSARGSEAREIADARTHVVEGDTVKLGSLTARVLDTPGHTARPHRLSPARARDRLRRRHAVRARLRPPVRRHAPADVDQPRQAARPARRHDGLLRPRIHRRRTPTSRSASTARTRPSAPMPRTSPRSARRTSPPSRPR